MSIPSRILLKHQLLSFLSDKLVLPSGKFNIHYDYEDNTGGIVYVNTVQLKKPLRDVEGNILTGRDFRRYLSLVIDLPPAVSLTLFFPENDKGLMTYELKGLLHSKLGEVS
jgi:hypothetical protein